MVSLAGYLYCIVCKILSGYKEWLMSIKEGAIACIYNSASQRHRDDVNFRLRAKSQGAMHYIHGPIHTYRPTLLSSVNSK